MSESFLVANIVEGTSVFDKGANVLCSDEKWGYEIISVVGYSKNKCIVHTTIHSNNLSNWRKLDTWTAFWNSPYSIEHFISMLD